MDNCINVTFGVAILLMLLWWLTRGSTVSFDQLTGEHSEAVIRLAKSKEIRRYMNESADPCDNFYEFACGNWKKINPATSMEHPTTGFLVSLLKSFDLKLRTMLLTDDAMDTVVNRSVKYFYRSCLNTDSGTQSYATKLKEIVAEFGQMSALEDDSWRAEDFDWMKTAAHIAYKYDIKLLVAFSIGMAPVDKSENGLFIDQPNFYLASKSLYLEDDNVLFIREYRSNVAHNLSRFLDLEELKAQRTAKEIIDFEISLVKGMVEGPLVGRFSEVFTTSTLEEVHRKYSPDLNIEQQINITLGTEPPLKVYTNQGYVQNLIEVIRGTPKKVVANYIFYHLLHEFMLQFPAAEQLEDSCMIRTQTHFIRNLDNIMYRMFGTNHMEKSIASIWLAIKSAFKSDLESQKLQWIKEDTRRYAVRKLNAMKLEFVAREQQRDLAQFSLNPHDYVENLKTLQALKASRERATLTGPLTVSSNADFWSPTPYYLFEKNAVKVPAAILLPFYTWSSSYPHALNFGMLGSILSHEIMHGFDQTGCAYDARGKPREWWDLDSTTAFKDRCKCFRDQYHKYILGGRNLPRLTDQGENIADNGGISVAYEAYLKLVESKADLKYMPGLTHFSHNQLFFISYAHMWCSDTFPEFRDIQISTDRHVPAEFRVIGPLSNMEAFAKVFNCPEGSGMNPIKQCKLY